MSDQDCSIIFNSYIQKIIFDLLFNDKICSYKWRLTLNLVSKRWFDFMSNAISNSKRKYSAILLLSAQSLSSSSSFIQQNEYNQQQQPEQHTNAMNSSKQTICDSIHLLDNQYCILSHCRSLVCKIQSFTPTTETLSVFSRICQRFEIILDIQIPLHYDYIMALLIVINRQNKAIGIIDYLKNFSKLSDFHVPIKYYYPLNLFDLVDQTPSDRINREKLLCNRYLQKLDCYSDRTIDQDIPQDSCESLRKFRYEVVLPQQHTITKELQFLSHCKQLVKFEFFLTVPQILPPLLEFLRSCQTLRTVILLFDFDDAVLSALLLNCNIRKIIIGKLNYKVDDSLDNDNYYIDKIDKYSKEYQSYVQPHNSTLRKLTFKIYDRYYSNQNQSYKIHFNPTSYISNLYKLSTNLITSNNNNNNNNNNNQNNSDYHNSWLKSLGCKENRLVDLTLTNHNNKKNNITSCILFEPLFTMNDTLRKLKLSLSFCESIDDTFKFVRLLEQCHSIIIVDIVAQRKIKLIDGRPPTIVLFMNQSQTFKLSKTVYNNIQRYYYDRTISFLI
ncbi:hypothetical protein PPL_06514 [Heterostelium album PN500]|uniref:F-box domain-containing protein n=1 Tax=Heterostelium pallidum (strain ATCC 26659 / Pp 5 / PN500) TaxID=670386 RepID=D3BDD1_HETP5|nr:hypothetical protein PPL_06514 [Heterostelium album PN500]EFA80575.1 hypothetical protein PPL_06514 [Heterostelium album PN500]|eukprot:XP_020432695.1 hypothetical protein PPL_06514 [Heterostelium album PN500]